MWGLTLLTVSTLLRPRASKFNVCLFLSNLFAFLFFTFFLGTMSCISSSVSSANLLFMLSFLVRLMSNSLSNVLSMSPRLRSLVLLPWRALVECLFLGRMLVAVVGEISTE